MLNVLIAKFPETSEYAKIQHYCSVTHFGITVTSVTTTYKISNTTKVQTTSDAIFYCLKTAETPTGRFATRHHSNLPVYIASRSS